MRNSAIHIITQMVGENISLFTDTYLQYFIKSIFLKMFSECISRYIEVVNRVKGTSVCNEGRP